MSKLLHEERKALIESCVKQGIWIDSDDSEKWLSADEEDPIEDVESSEEPDTISVDESDEEPERPRSRFIDDESTGRVMTVRHVSIGSDQA